MSEDKLAGTDGEVAIMIKKKTPGIKDVNNARDK